MLRISKHSLAPLLLVFLLVFELKSIDVRPIIPFSSVWQLLVVFVVFVTSVLSSHNKISRQGYSFLLLIALFFVWSLMASLKSDYPLLSLQRVLMLAFVTYLLGIAILSLPNIKQVVLLYIKGAVLFLFIISLLALIVSFLGELKVGAQYSYKSLALGSLKLEQAVMGSFYRTGGYLGNGNTISKWIVFLLPFLFMLYHSKEISFKMFVVILTIFSVMLVVALSRTGMALAFASVFVYWFLYTKSYTKKVVFIFFAVILGVAAITFFLYYFADTSRGSLDLNSRDGTWAVLFSSFLNTPLTGVGFGVSREVVLTPVGIDFAAHNFYLEKLVEVGLVGLFFALAPFVYAAKFAYKNIKRANDDFTRAFFSAAAAYFVVFFLYLNLETGLFVPSMWHLLVLIIACFTFSLSSELKNER